MLRSSKFIVALTVALCLAPLATAQDVEVTREARRQELFETGLEAARQHDYEAAYRYFRDSETAAGNDEMRPVTMYNMALAAAQSPRHELRAIAGFKAYLLADPSAENASQVTREIRRLQVAFEARLNAILRSVEPSVPAPRYFGEIEARLPYIAARLQLGQFDQARASLERVNPATLGDDLSVGNPSDLLLGFASDGDGSSVPQPLRDTYLFGVGFARALIEFKLERGDFAGAQRVLDATPSMRGLTSAWASFGCTALNAGNRPGVSLAIARLRAMPFEPDGEDKARYMARLGDTESALSFVRAGGLPEDRIARLQGEFARLAGRCDAGWWSGRSRYRFLRAIALGQLRHGTNAFFAGDVDDMADITLESWVATQSGAFTSTAREDGRFVSHGAYARVGRRLTDVAMIYRAVHGPF